MSATSKSLKTFQLIANPLMVLTSMGDALPSAAEVTASGATAANLVTDPAAGSWANAVTAITGVGNYRFKNVDGLVIKFLVTTD
jgi:hypothetical protein